jgi:type II secretory pathway pseudopilin PulG
LLEVLVVLAILGVVLAVTVPLLARRNAGAAVAGAVTEIRAALRTARDAAIAESRPVAFRGDDGGFWIDRHRYGLGATSAESGVRVAVVGGSRISFFPSGGSSGGHIVVRGTTASREIAVDPLTGRAELLP